MLKRLEPELKNFIRWNARNPSAALGSMHFLGQKLTNKIIEKRHGLYGLKYYPEQLRKFYEEQIVDSSIEIPKSDLYRDFSDRKFEASSILLPLASQNLQLDDNGDVLWLCRYSDPEDIEALHRFGWLIHLAISKHLKDEIKVLWAVRQLAAWCERFQNIENIQNHYFIWQSYTVSERLANICLFFEILDKEPPSFLWSMIKEFCIYLAPRFEFYNHGFGNHIINNARGLYLAACLLEIEKWKKLALMVLKEQLKCLVSDDGVLREGSSHYQLLLTRWLEDIVYFMDKYDVGEHRDLALMTEKCRSVCNFLMVHKPDGELEIPLFGDVSPDISPDVLIRLPMTCFKKIYSPWRGGDVGSRRKDEKTGWLNLNCGNQRLFLRTDRKGPFGRVGHDHDDFFHFSLFKGGESIFTDSGRLSYEDTLESNYGLSARAHNSFMIDGFSEMPENWRRYPVNYAKTDREVKVIEENGAVLKLKLSSKGFSRIGVPEAIRSIELGPKSIYIQDEFLTSKRSLGIATVFHFGYRVILERINDSEWFLNVGSVRGRFVVEGMVQEVLSFKGEEDRYEGWISRKYGQKCPASCLEIKSYWPHQKPIFKILWD